MKNIILHFLDRKSFLTGILLLIQNFYLYFHDSCGKVGGEWGNTQAVVLCSFPVVLLDNSA